MQGSETRGYPVLLVAQPLEMSLRSSDAKDSTNAPAGSASCGAAPPG